MKTNSEKLSIFDKRINLGYYHLSGHIIALFNFNYNFNSLDCWDYFNHNEIDLKIYDKTINELKYTLGNMKNTCIYLLSGLFCEFILYVDDNKTYNICFEDYFESFSDFIRSKINDQYETDEIIHPDIYQLMKIVFGENKLEKKYRKSNKKKLKYILKMADETSKLITDDINWEAIDCIFSKLFDDLVITYSDVVVIFRSIKLHSY